MLDYGMPLLARLKGLRGTGLDPFGSAEERRMERRLVSDYRADLDRIIAEWSEARARTAVDIAEVPQGIRGYGHVKAESVRSQDKVRADLWSAW